MSKITWTVETPDGTVSWEREITDEAKFAYFLDWAWDRFPQEGGKTPANLAKSIKGWMQSEWVELKRIVLADRKQQAAIAAKDAVEGIE